MNMRNGLIASAAAVVLGGLSTLPAAGMSAQAEPSPAAQDVGAQAVQYIPGKDVTLGSCKGWLNRSTPSGYVQAVGQSWGARCHVYLERRKDNQIDWRTASNSYEIQQSKASTGFHWNGRNAGSHVCIYNDALGGRKCGDTAW